MNKVTALASFLILSFNYGVLAQTGSSEDWEEGLAAYYSDALHGRRTANGEKYDKNALTAAHKTLPFGTVVRVTSLYTRHTVEVRINDRGPYAGRHRIIDLSRKAAEKLGMIKAGVIGVRIEVISKPPKASPQKKRKIIN